MFVCNKCGGEFSDDLRAKSYKQCKPCRQAYLLEWRARNPQKVKDGCAKWRAENRDYDLHKQAERRADPAFRQRARERSRAWYQENRDRALEWARANLVRQRPLKAARHRERFTSDPEYREKHRANTRTTRARRRAAEAAGLASYFTAELKAIYANCPDGYEVDHIFPLLGENASGLHVPWNLQYLPKRANRSKGNKILPTAVCTPAVER
jgi:DNA-directed RNA polymerase subunit RPC12/RpoP